MNLIDPDGRNPAIQGAVAVVVCGTILYVAADQVMQVKASQQCQVKDPDKDRDSCNLEAKNRGLVGNLFEVYGK